jgi:glycosyltransferase involved in cell wall biosynthesis
MREVFIISTGQIVKGKTAGSQRVMNVAKSLAAGNINVFLCSFPQLESDRFESIELSPGISYLKSTGKNVSSFSHLVIFLRAVQRFIKNRNSESVIYLYPTTIILKDFVYLFYFKIIKRYKMYCDINELRATNAFTSFPPQRFLPKLSFYLKSIYDFMAYKLSEIQVLFYDGIVVISSNLEEYFLRYTKRIIRVPILCDVTKIIDDRTPIHFDNKVFKICFAGIINTKKEGFDILFDALHELNFKKNVELYLYGPINDNDRNVLDQLTRKYMLRRKVFYKGNLDPDNLTEEFSKYHLLIIPRPLIPQTKYGFSTKLSEYLTSGVPVLVTDVSDNAAYIKDNYNGFVISPGSKSETVSKILEIIDNYDKNSSVIAKNAYRTAREEFDFKLYSRVFIDFFFKNSKDLPLNKVLS